MKQTALAVIALWLLISQSSALGYGSVRISSHIRSHQPFFNPIKPVHYFSKRSHSQQFQCVNTENIPPREVKSKSLRQRWSIAVADIKKNPLGYITIPIVAAIVGYITNYVGVKMLFYPITWTGIPFYRWENQPLGLIGWQGIMPAKRSSMAAKMVDVTLSKLISIPEMFSLLNPSALASLLTPTVSTAVGGGWIPAPILNFFLRRTSKDMMNNIESVLDFKSLVVTGLTADPTTIGSFFQKVGAKELKFLIESGMGFGFLLGLIQMVQWMLFPMNWTLPIGGAVVGYITNWIALKLIFEPLTPVKIGPFFLQGMFLKRQKEVSREFSEYIAQNILNSQKVWQSILGGPRSIEFKNIVSRNVPLSAGTVGAVISRLQKDVGNIASHPLHKYTDLTLNLKATLIQRMNLLSPAEFQQVLRPIFQEDELTLIIAGGILGGLAGLIQWWINIYLEKKSLEAIKKKELEEKLKIPINI